MNKVYALGVMRIDDSPTSKFGIRHDRLWTLYSNFEDAEKAMLSNSGDLFEMNYYNYGLIEEIHLIGKDMVADPEWTGMPREWWYFADYTTNSEDPFTPLVTQIPKPKSLEQMVFFWVG